MPSVDDLWEHLSRRAREAERARGSKRYVARWRTADGKSRKRRFHDRGEALAYAMTQDGAGPVPESAPATVADAVDRLTATKTRLSKRGMENHLHHAAHVKATLGAVAITAIDRDVVTEWLASDKSVASSSWSKRLTILRSALRLVGVDVPADIVVRRTEAPPRDFLTVQELVQVARTARTARPSKHGPKGERPNADMWELLILLMGTYGPRVTEAVSIKVGDVDIEGGRLTIRGTKTASSTRRVIRLSGWLRHRLCELAEGRDPSEYLFVNSLGKPFIRERVGDVVRDASERGIGRRIRTHDLRHTAATHLIDAGGLQAASTILGHADAGVTARIYGHTTDDAAARVAHTVALQMEKAGGYEVPRPPARPHPASDEPF